MGDQQRGWLYGLLGVLAFSQTLPITRLTVLHLDPLLVGMGRVVVAALPALVLLLWLGSPRLTPSQWRRLLLTAVGVVITFPLLSALSLRELPAAQGAVLITLLPLATAVIARFRTHERPSAGFWVTALGGTAMVMIFALYQGSGALRSGDMLMLGAVLIGGLGYAEGGRLAAEIGGWRVICWALLLGLPVALGLVLWLAEWPTTAVPLSTWLGFGYLSLISQFLGFFAWYQGMALIGVARTSQLQLMMPFMALIGVALLLGEPLLPEYFLFAAAVMVMVMLNRRTRVERVDFVHSEILPAGGRCND